MGIVNIVALLGGLALFLYGISLMGDGINMVAGDKLQTTLYKLTSSPIKGILLGIGVTALIQSSAAAVGILQALSMTGELTFATAYPIILGAAVGGALPVLISAVGASVNARRTAFVILSLTQQVLYSAA